MENKSFLCTIKKRSLRNFLLRLTFSHKLHGLDKSTLDDVGDNSLDTCSSQCFVKRLASFCRLAKIDWSTTKSFCSWWCKRDDFLYMNIKIQWDAGNSHILLWSKVYSTAAWAIKNWIWNHQEPSSEKSKICSRWHLEKFQEKFMLASFKIFFKTYLFKAWQKETLNKS